MIFNSECIRNLPARPAEGAGSALTALPKLPSWTGEAPPERCKGKKGKRRGSQRRGDKWERRRGSEEEGKYRRQRRAQKGVNRTYLQFMPSLKS